MTAPVSQSRGEKISMTAPVSQVADGNAYVVAFTAAVGLHARHRTEAAGLHRPDSGGTGAARRLLALLGSMDGRQLQ